MNPAGQATPRQAILAASLYAVALLATVAWATSLSSLNASLDEEIGTKRRVVAEIERRLAARAPGAPDAAAALSRGLASIPAPTETIAASRLQKQILERLEAAGGTVQSVQAEPVKDAAANGPRRLAAQLTFDCSVAGLQRLLFDLETGVPYAFVESLAAQAAPASVPGSRPGDRLRVTLSVSSYWTQK